MPYNPGVVDRSGEIRAQGRLAGGQALMGGVFGGLDIIQKNKELDKENIASIKAFDTMMKGMEGIAEGLGPQFKEAVTALQLKVSDTSQSNKARAQVAAQGMKGLTELFKIGADVKQQNAIAEQNRLVNQARVDSELAQMQKAQFEQGVQTLTGRLLENDLKIPPELIGKVDPRMIPLAMAEAHKLGGMKADAKAVEIDRLLKSNPNLTHPEATQLAYGMAQLSKDPVSGQETIVNLATGQSKPIKSAPKPAAAPAAEPAQAPFGTPPSPAPVAAANQPKLYDMADKATGILPNAIAAVQRVAGLTGQALGKDNLEILNAPEIIEAQQALVSAKQDLGRALANNPRFAEGEQQRIMKEVDISGGLLTDPTTLKAKMRSVNSTLKQRIDDAYKDYNNESLPASERALAIRAANDMTQFLIKLGVPEEGKSQPKEKASLEELKIDGYKVRVKSTR
jgi:hypothetical protein